MSDRKSDGFDVVVGENDPMLASELERALTAFNMAATGVTDEQAYSVKILDDEGGLVGGLVGWVWGYTSGISLVWIREADRKMGWGRQLVAAAEGEVGRRGCKRIYVSSFNFQAPDFYQRCGYWEIARVPGLLADGVEDVWLVKDIS